jgi:hypothetical protein
VVFPPPPPPDGSGESTDVVTGMRKIPVGQVLKVVKATGLVVDSEAEDDAEADAGDVGVELLGSG